MKTCENCGKEHDGEYASGRFCSSKCSKSFSTKSKRSLINKKVSKKLSKKPYHLICEFCGKIFETKNKKQKCCSVSCGAKLSNGWEKARHDISSEKWSIINKRSYDKGNNYVAGGTTKWYEIETSIGKLKVQGTYELRTCKILDSWKENGKIKNWEYTNDRISYIGTDNKKHSYLLDFKIFRNDNSWYYLEVKGYEKPNDKLKWKAVREQNFDLEIWFLDNIQLAERSVGVNG